MAQWQAWGETAMELNRWKDHSRSMGGTENGGKWEELRRTFMIHDLAYDFETKRGKRHLEVRKHAYYGVSDHSDHHHRPNQEQEENRTNTRGRKYKVCSRCNAYDALIINKWCDKNITLRDSKMTPMTISIPWHYTVRRLFLEEKNNRRHQQVMYIRGRWYDKYYSMIRKDVSTM